MVCFSPRPVLKETQTRVQPSPGSSVCPNCGCKQVFFQSGAVQRRGGADDVKQPGRSSGVKVLSPELVRHFERHGTASVRGRCGVTLSMK